MYFELTLGFGQLLVQCWLTVYDVGPTLNQHWINASCLLSIIFHSYAANSFYPEYLRDVFYLYYIFHLYHML